MSAPELVLSNVSKSFGRLKALDEVSFEVNRNTTVLLIGPNGAGKTTILRCIMGLLNFGGNINLRAIDVARHGDLARGQVGYVPQQGAYYENLSVLDEAKFLAKLKNATSEQVESQLKRFSLWERRKSAVRFLSSGMKQRLGLALALLKDPPFLILDEPTSNIDLLNQLALEAILGELAKEGKTILIATHLSGLDKYAERAIVLDKGIVIADGPPRELLLKINATDLVHVRPREEDMEGSLQYLRGVAVSNLSQSGDWVTYSVTSQEKAKSIKGLLEAGFVLMDVIVEQSSIESEYVRLLKENAAG